MIGEEYYDKMYQQPNLDGWTRVKNYYPMGTKIEREFKKNGIGLTTVVVDFNLETKIYALKLEDENADTEKETIIQNKR